jgi:uncharacterized membrane protein (DUF485 family)
VWVAKGPVYIATTYTTMSYIHRLPLRLLGPVAAIARFGEGGADARRDDVRSIKSPRAQASRTGKRQVASAFNAFRRIRIAFAATPSSRSRDNNAVGRTCVNESRGHQTLPLGKVVRAADFPQPEASGHGLVEMTRGQIENRLDKSCSRLLSRSFAIILLPSIAPPASELPRLRIAVSGTVASAIFRCSLTVRPIFLAGHATDLIQRPRLPVSHLMSESNRNSADDHATIVSHNARWGLILFAVYVVLYLGFMILAAYFPQQMAQTTPIGSVNVAIVYGIGLIVAALVLAMVYTFISRSSDAD